MPTNHAINTFLAWGDYPLTQKTRQAPKRPPLFTPKDDFSSK